ncbi:MAG TPA: Ig-like domain-containing protein, partial [Prolixibacteraceae bacterium]|nr:Ig-like domain-containing protein [Prolixibacteraceae bacterium]
MKNSGIFILALSLFFSFSIQVCYSNQITETNRSQENLSDYPNEIIFYSNGSTFSPVIVLQADAEVTWTWEDNTTSNSLTPTKDYGIAQLRTNRLKVTPWSALRRINIGYDAGDGGTSSIEFVANQKISLVENLHLVAPYLKEWCSSYNNFTNLDFSNFINIETIECYLTRSLQNVNLLNTPKLRRACFEDNNLLSLDLSDCSSLEDLRGAVNNYSTLTFPNQSDNAWHLCLRDNPQITNQHLINDLSPFPKIAELWIWNSNQQGDLIILKTNPTRTVSINAYNNHFSSIDFRGSLLNVNAGGIVDLRYNELTTVDISGCIQIKKLDLSHNMLNSEAIDQILKQVDEYGTTNGTIDLRYNQPPTNIRLVSKTNLESRGWIVNTDIVIPVESISLSGGTSINTDNGTLQLSATVLPDDATNKSIVWSVVNETGIAAISASGLLTAQKDGTVKVIASANDGSGVIGELTITITNQVIPVESITLSGGTSINIDNGTLQLSATALPDDATNKSVVWSVVNTTGQAAISASGLLTAQKDGTVKA